MESVVKKGDTDEDNKQQCAELPESVIWAITTDGILVIAK
jgi:hypothetical protein